MASRAYPARTWVSPKLVARASTIEGTGLFAIESIAEGETLSVGGGRVLTDDDVRSLNPPYSCFAVDEGVNLLIDSVSLIRFGNHSCDPNAWMADEVTEVARQPIVAGEEITIDYALQSVLPEWRMQCECGSPLCRGTITGNDWTREDLQERYGTHFSPFILRRLAASVTQRTREHGPPL